MARVKFQTLTEPMYYVLLSLVNESCGVDIMDNVKVISNGRILIGPGTLYAMLPKFEEAGMIKQISLSGRKKSYKITEFGKEMLETEYMRLKVMSDDGKKIMEGIYERKENS